VSTEALDGGLRQCTGCKAWKPATLEFYPRHRTGVGLNPQCRSCRRERHAEYYQTHRQSISAYIAKYRRDNRGRINIQKACKREESPSQTRLGDRRRVIKRKYRISVEEYEARLASQGGRCASCGGVFSASETPHLDHCHHTGKLRGFVHQTCNMGMGLFQDDPGKLRAAADYIEKWAALPTQDAAGSST
jgi:hypothetical protein